MIASTQLTALVDQLPDLDPSGKLTGPDPEAAEKLFQQVLSDPGGVAGLVDMLAEPEDGGDEKVRYLLHGLAVYLGAPQRAKRRAPFVGDLAKTLSPDRPDSINAFIVRQLQVAGGGEAAGTLGALLLQASLCEPAAQALLAIGTGALEQFRQALPKAEGAGRRTIVQALGVLRDAGSVAALKEALGDPDRETRLAAGWALANIGEPTAAASLIKAADDADGWERIQATKSCLLLAERVSAAGRKQTAAEIYKHLRETRTNDDERYIRDAAASGLAAVS